MMLRRHSPSASLSKIEVSSARSREYTPYSNVAAGSCHTGVLSFFALGATGGGLGGTRGKRSSSSVSKSLFSLAGSFPWCWSHKWLIILIFMRVLCMSWICWFLLWHGKGYMSPWVTGSLTRLGRWLIRKIRQFQHNMSHCGVLSWTRVQAKAGHVILSPFGSSSIVRTQVFSSERGKTRWAHHLSQVHQRW